MYIYMYIYMYISIYIYISKYISFVYIYIYLPLRGCVSVHDSAWMVGRCGHTWFYGTLGGFFVHGAEKTFQQSFVKHKLVWDWQHQQKQNTCSFFGGASSKKICLTRMKLSRVNKRVNRSKAHWITQLEEVLVSSHHAERSWMVLDYQSP